ELQINIPCPVWTGITPTNAGGFQLGSHTRSYLGHTGNYFHHVSCNQRSWRSRSVACIFVRRKGSTYSDKCPMVDPHFCRTGNITTCEAKRV
ncbi:hypothetical protein T265_04029, partial [Opisthorchis viverrini]